MFYSERVTEGVYWLGINDRTTHIFERVWPLPYGVAYNSYLVIGSPHTALIDTLAATSNAGYLQRIDQLLNGRKLDYLVINHMEPDHAGSLPLVMNHFPEAKLIGNKHTRKMLASTIPSATERFLEVEDAQSIELGPNRKLTFVLTPWVHWPETMMTYMPEEQLLFSGDAFGSYGALDGAIFDDEFDYSKIESEMRRYYSGIVGKYGKFVQRAFERLNGVPLKIICSTHGPIWRSHIEWVTSLYDRWSRQDTDPGVVIAVASMYGSTLQKAEYIARQLSKNGVRDIILHDVSKTHMSFILSDIWKYKGLILGSASYNTDLHPNMATLVHELNHVALEKHHVGIFATGMWGGGALKHFKVFVANRELNLIDPPVEIIGNGAEHDQHALDDLARNMAAAIKA